MSQDFNNFNLPEPLIKALTRIGFKSPTPIQEKALPLALQGRDILGSAQTGTGKTGAFGIPLITHLMANPGSNALVMTPTRELATQVLASIQQIIPVDGIKTALLIGGDPMPKQLRQLKNMPRLIVGTPGRINDHIKRGSVRLDNVGYLVMDEADRMLDMGFGPQIETIIAEVPEDHQTLLFSATISKIIVKLASKYLRNPERIAIGASHEPMKNIQQDMIRVSAENKYQHLLAELESREGSVIIFVKTKSNTERLAEKLNKTDHAARAIHGDLQQRKRDRVISSFRDKDYRVLVATDVAARGLDIPHIKHVINYDLPQCPEDYIHRIGRTARAGETGFAVNFLSPADDAKWRAIHRLIQGQDNEPQSSDFGGRKSSGKSSSYSKGKKPQGKYNPARMGRSDRAETSDRPARADRFEKSDRPARADRFEKSDRPARADRFEKSDRPARADRFEKSDRPARTDRFEKSDRPARTDRFEKSDRPARTDRFEKSDRPARADRFEKSDRPARADRFEKSDRPARADRKEWTPRDGKPAQGGKPRSFGKKPAQGGEKPAQSRKFSKPARFSKPAKVA